MSNGGEQQETEQSPSPENLLPSERLVEILKRRGSLIPLFPDDEAVFLISDLGDIRDRALALAVKQGMPWLFDLATILEATWYTAAVSLRGHEATERVDQNEKARRGLAKAAADAFKKSAGGQLPRLRSHLDELASLIQVLAGANARLLTFCQQNGHDPCPERFAPWLGEHLVDAIIKGRLWRTLSRLPRETFLVSAEQHLELGGKFIVTTEQCLRNTSPKRWATETFVSKVVRAWLRTLGLSAHEANDLMPRRK